MGGRAYKIPSLMRRLVLKCFDTQIIISVLRREILILNSNCLVIAPIYILFHRRKNSILLKFIDLQRVGRYAGVMEHRSSWIDDFLVEADSLLLIGFRILALVLLHHLLLLRLALPHPIRPPRSKQTPGIITFRPYLLLRRSTQQLLHVLTATITPINLIALIMTPPAHNILKQPAPGCRCLCHGRRLQIAQLHRNHARVILAQGAADVVGAHREVWDVWLVTF